MKTRDKSIDILRFIATVGIFFAHVPSPDRILQLRSFDVPLMALLMGTSFYLSSANKEINYWDYFKKRLKRLVKPTWEFLTLFFILVFVATKTVGVDFFSFREIITSYLLLDGIGYVWVIGVFLGVALLNPLILKVSNHIESNKKYFLLLLATYVFYLSLTMLQKYMISSLAFLYEHIILYTIGYGIIAAIGIRLKKLSNNEMLLISIISFIIYILIGIQNDFVLTSVAKYPPVTYYFSYALGAIFLLKLLLEYKPIFKIFDNKLVYFISKNSMWVYLWHIIPVFGIQVVSNATDTFLDNFIIQFVIVFIFSITATWCQNWLSNKILKSK